MRRKTSIWDEMPDRDSMVGECPDKACSKWWAKFEDWLIRLRYKVDDIFEKAEKWDNWWAKEGEHLVEGLVMARQLEDIRDLVIKIEREVPSVPGLGCEPVSYREKQLIAMRLKEILGVWKVPQ